MAGFHTIIRSARFVYSPYSATEMQGFAQVLADSIRARTSGDTSKPASRGHLKTGQLKA